MNKKLIALLLTGSMVMGTGAAASAAEEREQLKDLIQYVTDGTLLNPHLMINSANSTHLAIASNYNEGMFEMNTKGQPMGALVESYEANEDSSVWTFHLRQGVKWVDYQGNEKGEVTSRDFAMSHSIAMNHHQGDSINPDMGAIIGAQEYYEMTQEMDEDEAMALTVDDFLEAATGLELPDDYTIVYNLTEPDPAFWSAGLGQAMFPVAEGYVEEVGIENIFEGDLTKQWYSGPYIPVEFTAGNSLRMEQNPLYWDTECTRFDSLTWLVVSDNTLAYTLYENGEIDYVTLPVSTLRAIYEDENHKFHNELTEQRPTKHTFGIHFNFTKLMEDGSWDENWNKAVANENFRKAFYHGTDWTPYLQTVNFINPLKCDLTSYTVRNFVFFEDGTDYVDRVEELLSFQGQEGSPFKYQPELAEQYKAAAIEELTELGVTFPIEFVYHVSGSNQDEQDKGVIIKQLIEEGLGTDFMTVEIDTYVSSWTGEIINNRLQCIGIVGLATSSADPVGLIAAEDPYDADAMFSTGWSHTQELIQEPKDYQADLVDTLNEFSELLTTAQEEVSDLNARYEAAAQAEAFLLEHALVMPLHRRISWQLTHINDYTKAYAAYGVVADKLKNVEAYLDACTTADYEEFAAIDYEAE